MVTVRSSDLYRPLRSLLAGFAAGAIAAVVASVLSLPLQSPDDAYFNTASVTAGALLAGLAAGIAWWQARNRRRPARDFGLWMIAAALVVVVATLLAEAAPGVPLDGIARFALPLAGLVFLTVTLFTPVLVRLAGGTLVLGPATVVAVVAATAIGIGLAGRGDAESGRLSLSDLPPSVAPSTGPSAGAPDDSTRGAVIESGDVAGATFTVVAAQSATTYTVRQKLASLPLPNDVVGRTNAIGGSLHLDGRPSTITVDLRTLTTDEPQRDMFLRERLGLPFNRFPTAEFTVTSLPDLPSEYRAGEIVTRDVTGVMKLRDVERPLTFAVEARLQDGVLQVLGRTDFKMSDFQITPPNVAGFVQAEDGVHVEVLLVAKVSAGG